MRNLFVLVFALTFSALVSASDIPQLSCTGTEPFWNIAVNESSLSFRNFSNEEENHFNDLKLRDVAGSSIDFVFQIEAKNDAKEVLKLSVFKSECNDGMSDNVYTYTALVDSQNQLYFGCCN